MKRRSFLQGAAATAALTVSTPVVALAKTKKKETALGPLLEPWSGPHGGIPRFDQVKTADFKPAFTKGMDMLRAEIRAITTNNAPATFDNTVIPFEDAGRPFGRVANFFGVYTSTMNDKFWMISPPSATRSSRTTRCSNA
jgi:peptidyl-dipeptidase Dcp